MDQKQQIVELFDRYKNHLDNPAFAEIELLVLIVAIIRPKRVQLFYQVDIQFFLDFLKELPDTRREFVQYLKRVLWRRDFDQLVSDTGIISYADFIYELRKRITERYLPYQPAKSTLQYLLNKCFTRLKTQIGCQRFPPSNCISFFAYVNSIRYMIMKRVLK